MNNNIVQVTRRPITGQVAPDKVSDLEARRVMLSLIYRVQWILDNWPETKQEVAKLPDIGKMINDAIADNLPDASGGGGVGTGGGSTYTFADSVLEQNGNVTLVNDKLGSPGVNMMYGTDAAGFRAWLSANHSFRFVKTNAVAGFFTTGYVYIDGVSVAIGGFIPGNPVVVGANVRYGIAIDLVAKTATWGTIGGTLPAGTKVKPVFPIATIDFAFGEITTILQERASDFTLSSLTEKTIMIDSEYDTSDKQLKKKTQKVYIVTDEVNYPESGWTMITGGQAVPET